MNIEDFEKSKKELEKEKEQNNEKILISDERTRMAKVNQLEYKIETTLFFSMLGYAILFIITVILTNSLGASVIANILPGLSYPVALIGSSLGIGTIARTLMDKKFRTKERLKSFSTAKNQVDKLEEEVYYQIELEKANNRNNVIDETIKLLNSNQEMLSKLSIKYDLKDKDALQSESETKQKISELSTIIKEQYDKLDILSAQKVLYDRFWKIRQKFQRKTETMMASMLSGMFAMCFIEFPVMLLGNINVNLITILAPFITGVVAGSTYMIKRNNDYKKVFNNLNTQLGENALSENLDKKFESAYEEQKEIEALIEKQIRDISISKVQLQESKRCLDDHISLEKKEDICSKSHITEKTREDVLAIPCDRSFVVAKDKTLEFKNQKSTVEANKRAKEISQKLIDNNLIDNGPVLKKTKKIDKK